MTPVSENSLGVESNAMYFVLPICTYFPVTMLSSVLLGTELDLNKSVVTSPAFEQPSEASNPESEQTDLLTIPPGIVKLSDGSTSFESTS